MYRSYCYLCSYVPVVAVDVCDVMIDNILRTCIQISGWHINIDCTHNRGGGRNNRHTQGIHFDGSILNTPTSKNSQHTHIETLDGH